MVKPTLKHEKFYWSKGFNNICGIDEVGRGPWAGPLVAAGVILPRNFRIPATLADSKLVSEKKRQTLSKIIKSQALAFYIANVEPKIIDKVGLAKATHIVFRKVVRSIKPKPDFCLIDAFYIRHLSRENQLAIKDGDKICASIAAASIIAKVYRDNLMKEISHLYPNYGFEKHKGYGTKLHKEAIRRYGFSKIHRRSYKLDYIINE